MLAVAAAAGLGQGNVGEVRPMIGFIVEAAGSSQLAVCRVKLRSAHAGRPRWGEAVSDLCGWCGGCEGCRGLTLIYATSGLAPGSSGVVRAARRLPGLARYQRAIIRWLEKAALDPGRDVGRMTVVRRVRLPAGHRRTAGSRAARLPGSALDDRGATSQPFRPDAWHSRSRIRAADPHGPGSAGDLNIASPAVSALANTSGTRISRWQPAACSAFPPAVRAAVPQTGQLIARISTAPARVPA